MSAETLISELLDLPEQVHRGDFVLNLSEGVTGPRRGDPATTTSSPPQLADAFDDALGFIQLGRRRPQQQGGYLHGSFGAGKSHFMAVLHLLLQHDARARAHEGLARVCVKHDWVEGKKFLLVPYHMIGARNMESAILGGYVDHVRRVHPDAPWPGVYLADDLFANARHHREHARRREVLRPDSARAAGGSKWGKLGAALDRREVRGRGGGPARRRRPRPARRRPGQVPLPRLPGRRRRARTESFLSLDKGLSVISRHARDLGYDALILFLDELILWLATHAADLGFVHQEGQKLAKLVESPDARPAGADRQLRRPPARPARPGRRERHRRRAAQLRRRPAALGGPVPHDHPGGPQPPGHRREAGPAAQGRGVPRRS